MEKKEGLITRRHFLVVHPRDASSYSVVLAENTDEAAAKFGESRNRFFEELRIIPIEEIPLYEIKRTVMAVSKKG